MIYFDSDVLINSLVIQDEKKHEESTELIKNAIINEQFNISLLSLQEISFVLSKLNYSNEFIVNNCKFFLKNNPLILDLKIFQRVMILANNIGFSNINDCIHTAIAETYCDELITYNKKDFSKITKYSPINIRIL